ncbi:deoxyribonuclease [Human betaherpesvirus 5]|uniref:Deoxyribonuclease n=1 Tax=Human cytomegalovirus TaxID=10359 RepID=X4YYS6_HCMV|nr:deoxyribonuclease [Human betaherpesvirus 5]
MWGVSSLDYDDDEELTRLLAVWDDEPLSLFLMNTFLLHQEGFRNLPFTVLRLSYAYRIFAKMLRAHGTPVAEDFMMRVAALARDEGLRDILGQRHAAEASRAEIAEALERVAERCDDRHGGSDDYVWLSRLLDLAPNYRQVELFQLLEKESRGQSRNSVWHLLRMDTVSATKFYEAFVSGCLPGAAAADSSGGGGSHYTGSRAGVSPGIQFGIKHEGLVKTLVECYVMHGREPVRDGLGLLIDPTSGLLGASMDLCFGVLKQGSGRTLLVEPCARVYEIKCRYKYLRKKEDPFVQNVLRRHDAAAVASLLQSHPVPGVEFRGERETPSAREFLLSHDAALFRATLKRARPLKPPEPLREYLADLLYLNKAECSEVIVFDAKHLNDDNSDGDATTTINASLDLAAGDAAGGGADHHLRGSPGDSPPPIPFEDENTPELLGRLNVYEVARFSLPAFVNPRHQYYFQMLIQQYVLSQYYIKKHPDPERIDFRDLPTVYLVSAIFREREESELGCELLAGGRVFHCDHIPLLLIVTPVVFDPQFTRHAVSTVLDRWSRDLSRKTNLPIWVPNSANEYVVSSVPRPVSP